MQIPQVRRNSAVNLGKLSKSPIAIACGLLLISASAAHAQTATAPASLESVTVTGIRKSLDSSLDLKRESRGLVDGIVAEDIGKFPDTNLAESLQRIAGVSIDRAPNGEGSKVTVRGIGPEFNLVLLNGRQMPSATISAGNGGASSSRAYDFANLASESVSALEVYKTSRAASPSGGIGATINIKTTRPLDVKGQVASVALKGNIDNSNNRVPNEFKGSDITPELSGIYVNQFLDGTLGIAISGSYQKRDSGSNKAYTQNGWRGHKGSDGGWDVLPQPGEFGADLITNRPKANDIYSIPVDLRYGITALERERTNGQLTLQYAPNKDVKITADYMLANNKVNSKYQELANWFNFGAGPSTWTNGPVSSPLIRGANFTLADAKDIQFGSGVFGQTAELRSTGFNVEWKASDKLKLEFDAHHSTSYEGPNSPNGSFGFLSLAQFNQGNAIAYYDQDLPILSWPTTTVDPSKVVLGGSQFARNESQATIDQFQFRGAFKLDDASKLQFGLSSSKLNNRSNSTTNQNSDWGSNAVGTPADYPDSAFSLQKVAPYFSAIKGSNDPRLTPNLIVVNFDASRAAAVAAAVKGGTSQNGFKPMTQAQAEAYFSPPKDFTGLNIANPTGFQGATDLRTTEKSTSAFAQYELSFDGAGIPMNIAVGLRQEKTDVTSTSLVPAPLSSSWGSLNEVTIALGDPTFGTGTGSYSYLLPSIDWDADLAPNVKARASYGETIGRPGWGDLRGGASVNGQANFGGGTGATGNPALKPLLSKNLDFSLEYYYAKSSYAAGSLFYKKISDFIVGGTTRTSVGGVRTPIGGKYFNAAIASGCTAGDPKCLRNYIFRNFNGQPGVTRTGALTDAEISGVIVAQPDDPLLQFSLDSRSNGPSDNVKGLEFNGQHAFAGTGFGVAANYTKVRSGFKYDVTSLSSQAPLAGVSDSANLVGFYEDDTYSIRAAYNWRDEFYAYTSGDGNPVFTEPYGQLDMTLGYKWNKNLSFQADFINLNDGVVRQHARSKSEVVSVTQTGRRYLFGVRYKF